MNQRRVSIFGGARKSPCNPGTLPPRSEWIDTRRVLEVGHACPIVSAAVEYWLACWGSDMENKRRLPSVIAAVGVSAMIIRCGDDSGDSDNGHQAQDGGQSDASQNARTPEQVQDDIRAEVESLNSCNVLEDCTAVYIPGACSNGYINANADRAHLDELIAEYSAVGGLEPPCVMTCETLSCAQDRCVTQPAPPSDVAGEGERLECH